MASIKDRVSDFKNRFSNMFGGRQGYEELETLERPLVGAEDEDRYEDEHGVRPSDTYQPPQAGGGERPAAVRLPSQSEELQVTSILAQDASEILWEMVAMGESGAAQEEMRTQATQLQAQLRGLINDYAGGEEKLLMAALEAFDMLGRCLEDSKEGPPPVLSAEEEALPEAAAAPPPPPAMAEPLPPVPPPQRPAPAAEAPLISFD